MPISNYPGGFASGITIRNLPILNTYGGKVFWVDSGSGADTGSYKGTFDRPFATLDYAIGRCTANNGDVILVKAGHAETLIADSGVDIDVAGITVFGLGNGEDRPIFTFTTDADADFKIAAANTAIHNLVFKCNIASQAMMIEVTGDDAEIGFCEFREGSATGLNFITIGVADNDADRCHIHDCDFYMPTAGNGDSAINFAKDHAGVKIERCHVYGDFDLAGIDIPAGGNAQVDCLIKDCVITNLLTGQHAIQVNGTGSTGKIINCFLQTDAQATSIDAGGMECYNVLWHIGTDQTEATLALAPVDGSTNFIGADNSNNAAATTNVAANEDGSILERLEQLQEAINKGSGSALAANESIVDVLYAANGIGTFPVAAAAANGVSIAEVIRYIQESQIGTLVNAGGTATIGGIFGDFANDSLVARLEDIGSDVDSATTDNIQGKLGTDTQMADRSMFDILCGDGPAVYPAAAAAANDVSIAEVVRYVQDQIITGSGTVLPNNQSVYDLLAGANGIATFPAAAAPANAVSIAEVLRAVYDRQLGDGTSSATNCLLGKKVTRAAADIFDGTTRAIFTIATGRVLLTHIEMEVTTAAVDAAASNTKLQSNPTVGTTGDLCANLDVNADELGSIYTITGVATDALLGGTGGSSRGMSVKGIVLPEGAIELVSAVDVGTGGALVKCEAWYIPLDDGATLAAA